MKAISEERRWFYGS